MLLQVQNVATSDLIFDGLSGFSGSPFLFSTADMDVNHGKEKLGLGP